MTAGEASSRQTPSKKMHPTTVSRRVTMGHPLTVAGDFERSRRNNHNAPRYRRVLFVPLSVQAYRKLLARQICQRSNELLVRVRRNLAGVVRHTERMSVARQRTAHYLTTQRHEIKTEYLPAHHLDALRSGPRYERRADRLPQPHKSARFADFDSRDRRPTQRASKGVHPGAIRSDSSRPLKCKSPR